VINTVSKKVEKDVFNDKKINHYLLASALTTLAGLISFPVLTRLLSKTDYGIFSLIQAAQLFYEAVLKSGFQFSIVRHYSVNKDGNRLVFLKSLLIVPATISFLITIILSLVIVTLSYYKLIDVYFLLVLVAAQGSVFLCLFRSYMHATGRSKSDSFIDVLYKYSYLILVIPFVLYLSSSYWGVIGAICVASVLCACMSIWINRDVFQAVSSNVDWKLIKSSYRYSLPLMLTEITILSIAYIDRFVMAAMDVEFSDIGIYAIGFGLANVIYMFLWKALQPSLLPNANEIHDQVGAKSAVQFLERNINFLLLVFICLITGVFLNSKDFIVIICGSDKSDAYIVFEFATMLFLLKVLSNLMFYGFNLKQNTKAVFISEISVVIVNIVVNILLIPIWGMYGALVATFIAFSVGIVIKQYLLDGEYKTKSLFKGSLFVVCLMGTYILLHEILVVGFIETDIYRMFFSILIFFGLLSIRPKFWIDKFRMAFKYKNTLSIS
jgi:O-antigen/teichoic acid export membrane protein